MTTSLPWYRLKRLFDGNPLFDIHVLSVKSIQVLSSLHHSGPLFPLLISQLQLFAESILGARKIAYSIYLALVMGIWLLPLIMAVLFLM